MNQTFPYRFLVLAMMSLILGLGACGDSQGPRKLAKGLIRKGKDSPSSKASPGSGAPLTNEALRKQIESQLRSRPGAPAITTPPPNQAASQEVQRVMSTVEEINRINAMNRRNQ